MVAYVKNYQALGGAEQLWRCTEPECLIEGPAGTGKSRAVLEKLDYLCRKYPGIRVLIYRKTRVSMTETVLVTFEEHVLTPNDPIKRGAGRATRRAYTYANGSTIVVAGMDQPSRIMSSEYDLAACFEATEITEEDFEMVLTRLRNNKIRPPGWGYPFTQHILDCNPADEFHWLNRRCDRKLDEPGDPRHGLPMLHRILSRHEDNPSVTEQYLQRLRRLTGVRRARLYEGKWVSAAGQVWDNYDPAIHLFTPTRTVFRDGVEQVESLLPPFKWHFASVDWGYRKPGCMQVWGVTADRDLYRVAEIYRTGETDNWWADRAVELYHEFNLLRIVCDPAEPDRIAYFNDRLGTPRKKDAGRIAVEANNQVQTGLNHVRTLFERDQRGRPQIYLVRDVLRYGPDPSLVEAHKPWCTEQEIPAYCYPLNVDGKPIKEKPDDNSEDHGCDALRYAAMYAWRKDYETPAKKKTEYAAGTLGAELGHAEVERDGRWRGRIAA